MIWGQTARYFGKMATDFKDVGIGKYGGTMAGSLWGWGAGAAYGAMSDDTSILGGALMGAGMGAAGGRYGASALRRGRLGARGIGVGGANTVTGFKGAMLGAGRGLFNRARADYRGAVLLGNKARNGFNALQSRTRESQVWNAYGHMF